MSIGLTRSEAAILIQSNEKLEAENDRLRKSEYEMSVYRDYYHRLFKILCRANCSLHQTVKALSKL